MPITADPSWPGIEPNVRVMTESLGKALVGVVVQNWPAVVEGFFSALGGGFQQGEPSLEQQVGRWWRTAGYMALTTCLQDAHWGLVLSDEECKTGALERIEALLHKDSLSLDAEGWQDPAYSAFGQVLAQDFPHFLTELHTDTRLNTDQQQAMLRDAFYRAARWLQVHEPALCQAIEAQLFSQQAQAEQLRQSMARHRRWIDQLFFHEPVFGEKGEGRNGTPLAQLYVAPRGYRRAEIEREERRDDAPPPRYEAVCDQLEPAFMAWLQQAEPGIRQGRCPAQDRLRVLAGGPGCGKSSFARYFATQVMRLHPQWQLVFLPLHRFREPGELYEGLEKHLDRIVKAGAQPCEGIRKGALTANDPDKPLLLIFDGLDELHSDQQDSVAVTQDFVARVMRALETSLENACALILGRPAAVSQAVAKIRIQQDAVWYFLPARQLKKADFTAQVFGVDFPPWPLPFDDEIDPRSQYWRKWSAVNGFARKQAAPQGLLAPELEELTGEPLLLHMLALASRYAQLDGEEDYLDEAFHKAADNRNRVYEQLFWKVLERDIVRSDGGPSIVADNARQAFDLLQCLGLAAWQDSGARWGMTATYDRLLALRFHEGPASDLLDRPISHIAHIVALFFTNLEAAQQNRKFEFLHKSFGEYLAAKGLFETAKFLIAVQDKKAGDFAQAWLKLVRRGAVTHELVDWMNREAELMAERDLSALADLKVQLNQQFIWVQQHGFPAHHDAEAQEHWRDAAQRQVCAEITLLALLQACARALQTQGHPNAHWNLKGLGDQAFDTLVRRLTTHDEKEPARRLFAAADLSAQIFPADLKFFVLRGANLQEAKLKGAELQGADLLEANLLEANLLEANLQEANLQGVKLRRANLQRAKLQGADLQEADLRGANLQEANLQGVKLRRANLQRAKLQGANLDDADLRGVNLLEAKLQWAQLQGVNLQWTKLDNADLKGALLTHAILPDAQRFDATYHTARVMKERFGVFAL